MTKLLLVFFLGVVCTGSAAAQGKAEDSGYAGAKQRVEVLRTKPGVNVSVQSGWTVIEDRANLSLWSFTPPGHRAYPAAIQRQVVQEGDNLFIKMNVLCDAPQPDC